jgi:hypothetical protein
VRISLAPGAYDEDVVLRPFVTLVGAVGGEVRLFGIVLGAPASGLEHLSIIASTQDEVLLSIANGAMRIRHVLFQGDMSLPATGILVEGLTASGSVIEGCVFSGLSVGIDILGGVPLIRRCVFENLSLAGIIVREGSSLGATNPLGLSGDPATGWNTFAISITGPAVINLDDEVLRAQQNDWGVNGAAAIAARVSGRVDTSNPLAAGSALDAAVVHVVVWDAVTNTRIRLARVSLDGLVQPVQTNSAGVATFAAVAPGATGLRVTATGYAAATLTAFPAPGEATVVLVPLNRVERRGFLGCGPARAPLGSGWGDLLFLVMFLGGLASFRTWRRHTRPSSHTFH